MRALRVLQAAFVALLLAAGPPVQAQPKTHHAYVFGNSLIHHLSDSEETSVPHWLALMAREAGHDFALSGQWGFLRDFRRTLPPTPNWSFTQVKESWDDQRTAFGDAGLTSVWINPANFIQYNSASDPFDGDNPERLSPIVATTDILQWVADHSDGMHYFVYEGWPEMGALTGGFPPTDAKLKTYHAYALGPYAAWYDDYVARLSEGGAPVSLIPVSRVLSSVMTDTALGELSAETFYADDAPHGTAALYLMAAMVTYNTIFDEPLPDSFRPPSTVAPEIRATFPMVRDAIWDRVAQYREASAAVPSIEPVKAVDTIAPMAPKAVVYTDQVENPSLAMGLNGIADWSVQHPFIDLMKTARPWVGHTNDQWGAFTAEMIAQGGYLDDQGWPKRLPEGARAVEAFILTDQPEAATDLAGRYIVTYEGKGDLSIGGIAKNVRRSDGEMSFDYSPGEGLVAITITATDPSDHIRNIRVFREDYRALADAGVTFNPAFLARIENLRSLRFMDWMSTNGSQQITWNDRPTPDSYSYVPSGVPIEVMVELSNIVGADPWFNIPHMADDDYVRRFAGVVKETLRPDLHSYVEYSNEVWNFIFPQAKYAQEQAQARWGKKAPDDAWMQFYGMRTAQIAQIWTEVYGTDAAERLVPVIATHTGWLGLEAAALYAPLWVKESSENWEPYVYVKAYAITGYFGYEMGTDEQAPNVLDWIKQSREAAQNEAATRGLTGKEAETFIADHQYTLANRQVDRALREGSVKELQDVIFVQQAKVAEDHGLSLVMYEGGTHVAVSGEFSQNEALIAFFKQFNYSDEIAAIYTDLLTSWKAAGGTMFNAFVDISKPSQYGSWGALRHLQDDNPRWQALMAFNRATPAWWESRAPGTFEGGHILNGTDDPDTIVGTSGADVLAGLAGDDILRPVAGRDLLLGGDGMDAALLPGAPSDYSFVVQASSILVRSDTVEAELRDIEMLWFGSDDTLAIMVDDLR